MNEASDIYKRGIAKATLGLAEGWNKFFERAIADYDQVIGLEPNHADAYTERALLKDTLGRHEEALADFDRVVRLRPDDPWAYYNRSFTKSLLGQREDAITDLDEAIRIQPDFIEAYYNRVVFRPGTGWEREQLADMDSTLIYAERDGHKHFAGDLKRIIKKLKKKNRS